MHVAEYAIGLEDGPLNLTAWRGMTSPNGKHPFFFFNACDVGQAERVANFVDGWAPAVLEAGVTGYIGPLWPIGDKGAADFATEFYATLNSGLNTGATTVGDVLRRTRALYVQKRDPTFLAYSTTETQT